MIWRIRNNPHPHKDYERFWVRKFCWWPKQVEGYYVWLACVESLYECYHRNTVPRKYHHTKQNQFRLTEAQKFKLGIKW